MAVRKVQEIPAYSKENTPDLTAMVLRAQKLDPRSEEYDRAIYRMYRCHARLCASVFSGFGDILSCPEECNSYLFEAFIATVRDFNPDLGYKAATLAVSKARGYLRNKRRLEAEKRALMTGKALSVELHADINGEQTTFNQYYIIKDANEKK